MPQKKDRHGDRARESRQEEFARTLERVNLERKGVSLLHRWVINDLLLHHILLQNLTASNQKIIKLSLHSSVG